VCVRGKVRYSLPSCYLRQSDIYTSITVATEIATYTISVPLYARSGGEGPGIWSLLSLSSYFYFLLVSFRGVTP
jgi:hypothetical protein